MLLAPASSYPLTYFANVLGASILSRATLETKLDHAGFLIEVVFEPNSVGAFEKIMSV